jgi:hypothetical protein
MEKRLIRKIEEEFSTLKLDLGSFTIVRKSNHGHYSKTSRFQGTDEEYVADDEGGNQRT